MQGDPVVRRRTTRRRGAGALGRIAVVVVAVITLAPGPAGAATDAETWGDTFCSETINWLSGATQGVDELQTASEDPTLTAAEGKALIVDFLKTGAAATKAYERAMKQAGVPDIENGAKIQAAILTGIAGSAVKIVALERDARKLPTKPERAFDKAAAKLGDRLDDFSAPFGKGMTKAGDLDKGNQLGQILRTLPACAPLAGGSPQL